MLDIKLLRRSARLLSSLENRKMVLVAGYQEHGNETFLLIQDEKDPSLYILYRIDLDLPKGTEIAKKITGYFTFHFDMTGEKGQLTKVDRVCTLEKLEV